MPTPGDSERILIEALDDPALIVERGLVALANQAARQLLGEGIERRDVRLAIRHPQALDMILAHDGGGEVDVSGLVEPGRSWRLVIRRLRDAAVLVRMIDRSDAVSAEKMRVDFVANASHELRTPLSTVIGYAETLAEDDDLPPELRINFGRTIRDEARRMLRIIEDLMSLSRIEADRFLAPAEQVDLGEVVAASVANAAHIVERAGCRLDQDLAPGLPPIRGDRTQLIQLLDNLIGNAVRYGCNGAGSVIRIATRTSGGWVELSVQDQGPGIAREHLPRVTERFYRADPARSRESGGTGLGLAIVKHIVERHRGLLDIRSGLGEGTTVSARFPQS